MTEDERLTEDEIKLYDRQIRLWGFEAQTRMRNSRILLINLTSIGVEIVKNLMLGGIGSLTICDSSIVLEQDLNVNFFINSNDVGKVKVESSFNKIKELNPRVELKYELRDYNSIELNDYSLIIATGLDLPQLIELNKKSRLLNIPLYACSTHGLYGYMFVDLITSETCKKYESNEKKEGMKLDSNTEIIKINKIIENDLNFDNCIIKCDFKPIDNLLIGDKFSHLSAKKLKKITPLLPILIALSCFKSQINKSIDEISISFNDLKLKSIDVCNSLKLPISILDDDDELIQQIANQAYCEFQPVSAILGGTISQEVINMLGKRELPINNYLILDGVNNEMPIFNL
ncbi:hypothetical protein CANARDRAFT_178156 [[Candida] arabinofermentans NRRL YB-2248]|uniref:Ubiquitin-like 1-activating enzyme E1A n=1 Tax=[Candida] arabinofermentans NRRL YB-2248 TaxID=983967 RepID=A0A1E4STM7_9ASCO|nr:hypothetical protein CANARDRAFT_178156 [[Candida] arabinofermentans NRRL YB-2248]